MTLKKSNNCESYPMARGAKFDYDDTGSETSRQGRRCVYIQWIVILFMLAYLILLTVWLYPTFPMFSQEEKMSEGIFEEMTALKEKLDEAQNQSHHNLSQWKEKIDKVDELSSQQDETQLEFQKAVQLLHSNAKQLNQSLFGQIEQLQTDLKAEKEKRSNTDKSVAALMRRVSNLGQNFDDFNIKYTKDSINVTSRLKAQESNLMSVTATARNNTGGLARSMERIKRNLNATIHAVSKRNIAYYTRLYKTHDKRITYAMDSITQCRVESNESLVRVRDEVVDVINLVEEKVKNISAALEDFKLDNTNEKQIKVLADNVTQMGSVVTKINEDIIELYNNDQQNVLKSKARLNTSMDKVEQKFEHLILTMVDHEHNIENLMNQSIVFNNSSEGLREQLKSTEGEQLKQRTAVNHSLSDHGVEIAEVRKQIAAIQEDINSLKQQEGDPFRSDNTHLFDDEDDS